MRKLLDKIIIKIANSKIYVITFLISMFVISLLYIFNNVTPFGEKSLLCIDFYHQYGPMLGELYDKVHHGTNLIYSFNMGLGLPFFRNFLNYMSSPFNIIIFLFSRYDLVTSYSYIIGLKAVMSSISFVYFLTHKFKSKELYFIPLGILYAFSAYYSAYYWNIMWLDGMVFLPLITLGIERIVNEGKWKFYTIWLAIMLISNYFIGYMVCIFSVVYFLIYNVYKFHFTKGKMKQEIFRLIKSGIKFAYASLLAGMLAAVFLIPMYYAMKSISATGGSWPISQYYKFTIEDFLKYHLSGVSTTVLASDPINAPNVSCGILSITLLVLFLLNKKIPFKTKICYTLLLSFFIVAFFNVQLDYILHAFHVPNDLPYRYSFLYTFVLMVIAAYSIHNLKDHNYILPLIVYIFMMLLLISITNTPWTGLTNNMIYINMILLTLYFIFYSGSHFVSSLKNIFFVAMGCVAAIDVVVSINYNWNITQILDVFYSDYNKTEELLQYVDNYDDSKFYRIENAQMMTLNDPSWYNYHGLTAFSSMAYESVAKLLNSMGLPGNNINSYYYTQTTPIVDMMLDMKYFIGITNDEKRYTPLKTIDETANVFNYNISLGYGVNKEIKDWSYVSSNPFEIQNDYIEKSTGIKDVLEEQKPSSSEELYNNDNQYVVRYTYEYPGDNMYFYTDSSYIDFILIGTCLYYNPNRYYGYIDEVPGLTYQTMDNYDEEKVINIKTTDNYLNIYVGYNFNVPNSYYMYGINHDKFARAYDILRENKMNIYEFNESSLKANISLNDDKTIYTSIPYDEGWHVYVDDEEVETKALADAFLVFDVDKGTHNIVFKYEAKGFKLGLAATLTAIVIILFDTILNKKILIIFKKKKA